jgi:hypothetical protein
VWAVDRDAGQLVGLDARLYVQVLRPIELPLAVRARADGGAWVLAERAPGRARSLIDVDPGGAVRARFDPGERARVLDLERHDGGDALLLIDEPSGCRVLRVAASPPGSSADTPLRAVHVAHAPGALCLSSARGRIAVGDERGRVRVFAADAPDVLLAEQRLAERRALDPETTARITDLVSAADGGWWALDARGSGRLVRLSAGLVPSFEAALLEPARSLAAVPGASRVWVVSDLGARRFGPGGLLERAVLSPLSGCERAVCTADGDTLLVAPGALVGLLADGEWGAGQGGFDYLVDADVVPRGSSDKSAAASSVFASRARASSSVGARSTSSISSSGSAGRPPPGTSSSSSARNRCSTSEQKPGAAKKLASFVQRAARRPVSSSSSRRAAASGSSPGSTVPAGISVVT